MLGSYRMKKSCLISLCSGEQAYSKFKAPIETDFQTNNTKMKNSPVSW